MTLFAADDSATRARLVTACPSTLRLIEDAAGPQAFHFAMLERVARMCKEYLVHFHTDYQSFPFARSNSHITLGNVAQKNADTVTAEIATTDTPLIHGPLRAEPLCPLP